MLKVGNLSRIEKSKATIVEGKSSERREKEQVWTLVKQPGGLLFVYPFVHILAV